MNMAIDESRMFTQTWFQCECLTRGAVLTTMIRLCSRLDSSRCRPVVGFDRLWLATSGSSTKGGEGPGQGKNVVLISGDEEYRSEEALPQLAKILAKHHGFTCTVLFAIGKDGTIDPNRNDNIPGLEALRKADLMIIATRFRDLPEDQMKEIVDYVESGRPDHRHANGDPRLQHQGRGQEVRPLLVQ